MKRTPVQIAAIALVLAAPSYAGGFFDSILRSLRPNPDSSASSNWQLSSEQNQTSDSSYIFRSSALPASALVQIQIQLKEKQEISTIVYVPVSDGRISKRIYLPFGPGAYTILAWSSSNPDRYQPASGWTYLKSVDIINTDPRDMSDLLPSGDVQSDAPEIVSLSRTLTSAAQSDMEKALAIHDWITKYIKYDVDSYFDKTYATKVVDALSTLHEGASVCQGYSNLFAALARAAGLRTKIVKGAMLWPGQTWERFGTTQPHAWNEVQVEGRWVSVDTTWDSGGVDLITRQFTRSPSQRLFDPSPESFALDHRKLGETND